MMMDIAENMSTRSDMHPLIHLNVTWMNIVARIITELQRILVDFVNIIIPAKAFARDYVITGVGLSVCLSVCLSVTTITK